MIIRRIRKRRWRYDWTTKAWAVQPVAPWDRDLEGEIIALLGHNRNRTLTPDERRAGLRSPIHTLPPEVRLTSAERAAIKRDSERSWETTKWGA